jgi:hypothetical protein
MHGHYSPPYDKTYVFRSDRPKLQSSHEKVAVAIISAVERAVMWAVSLLIPPLDVCIRWWRLTIFLFLALEVHITSHGHQHRSGSNSGQRHANSKERSELRHVRFLVNASLHRVPTEPRPTLGRVAGTRLSRACYVAPQYGATPSKTVPPYGWGVS